MWGCSVLRVFEISTMLVQMLLLWKFSARDIPLHGHGPDRTDPKKLAISNFLWRSFDFEISKVYCVYYIFEENIYLFIFFFDVFQMTILFCCHLCSLQPIWMQLCNSWNTLGAHDTAGKIKSKTGDYSSGIPAMTILISLPHDLKQVSVYLSRRWVSIVTRHAVMKCRLCLVDIR